MSKTTKRGKGGTSFVSVVKEALDRGVTDSEAILKVAQKALPGIDEKKLRARVNATIKYLGKKPVKTPKAEKKEKVVKEEKKVEAPKVETPVAPVIPEAPKEELGDIVIQWNNEPELFLALSLL